MILIQKQTDRPREKNRNLRDRQTHVYIENLNEQFQFSREYWENYYGNEKIKMKRLNYYFIQSTKMKPRWITDKL